jgi:hypothetical protein
MYQKKEIGKPTFFHPAAINYSSPETVVTPPTDTKPSYPEGSWKKISELPLSKKTPIHGSMVLVDTFLKRHYAFRDGKRVDNLKNAIINQDNTDLIMVPDEGGTYREIFYKGKNARAVLRKNTVHYDTSPLFLKDINILDFIKITGEDTHISKPAFAKRTYVYAEAKGAEKIDKYTLLNCTMIHNGIITVNKKPVVQIRKKRPAVMRQSSSAVLDRKSAPTFDSSIGKEGTACPIVSNKGEHHFQLLPERYNLPRAELYRVLLEEFIELESCKTTSTEDRVQEQLKQELEMQHQNLTPEGNAVMPGARNQYSYNDSQEVEASNTFSNTAGTIVPRTESSLYFFQGEWQTTVPQTGEETIIDCLIS